MLDAASDPDPAEPKKFDLGLPVSIPCGVSR